MTHQGLAPDHTGQSIHNLLIGTPDLIQKLRPLIEPLILPLFQELQTGLIELFIRDLNIGKNALRHHLLHQRTEQIKALQKSTAFLPNHSL